MSLRISIVTVCYNMAPYIEQTLLSVLSQNYPNLEYIVIDGGSSDGTQVIIEKYKEKLAYYVSEPDKGMYDAINKGFSHATGDIIAWINADDIYMPWTLRIVDQIFTNYLDVNWIGGRYAFLTEEGLLAHVFPKSAMKSQTDIRNGWCRSELLGPLLQEGMFWRRSLFETVGGLDVSYKLAGDFELWTRFAEHAALTAVDIPLAAFRRRKGGLSIGQRNKYNAEVQRAIVSKPKYPNVLWRIGEKVPIIRQFLRFFSYRKCNILYYTKDDSIIRIKQFRGSTSSQCLESLRLYH